MRACAMYEIVTSLVYRDQNHDFDYAFQFSNRFSFKKPIANSYIGNRSESSINRTTELFELFQLNF